MFLSQINVNRTAMTSTVLSAQYVKSRDVESTGNVNIIQLPNKNVPKQAEYKRIYSTGNVNIKYIASALHKEVGAERAFKSLWA